MKARNPSGVARARLRQVLSRDEGRRLGHLPAAGDGNGARHREGSGGGARRPYPSLFQIAALDQVASGPLRSIMILATLPTGEHASSPGAVSPTLTRVLPR